METGGQTGPQIAREERQKLGYRTSRASMIGTSVGRAGSRLIANASTNTVSHMGRAPSSRHDQQPAWLLRMGLPAPCVPWIAVAEPIVPSAFLRSVLTRRVGI